MTKRGVMQAPRSCCTMDPHTPVGGKLRRVFLLGLCPVGSLRHSMWPYCVFLYYAYVQLGHVMRMRSPAYCRVQRIGRRGTIVVYLHIKKSTLTRCAESTLNPLMCAKTQVITLYTSLAAYSTLSSCMVNHKGAIAPLYIGMTRVRQHHSHTFEKSTFLWQ